MKPKHLRSLVDAISQFNERVGQGVSWLTTLLVLLVGVDVVIRYLINDTRVWVIDLEWHLFSLIFLLGAGYALKHDRHVRVDLFYSNFSARDKALVNLIGGIVFLLPWCILLIIVAIRYASISYQIGESSADPGGLPGRFVIKFGIAFGLFLLLLQGIAQTLEAYLVWSGKEELPPSGKESAEHL